MKIIRYILCCVLAVGVVSGCSISDVKSDYSDQYHIEYAEGSKKCSEIGYQTYKQEKRSRCFDKLEKIHNKYAKKGVGAAHRNLASKFKEEDYQKSLIHISTAMDLNDREAFYDFSKYEREPIDKRISALQQYISMGKPRGNWEYPKDIKEYSSRQDLARLLGEKYEKSKSYNDFSELYRLYKTFEPATNLATTGSFIRGYWYKHKGKLGLPLQLYEWREQSYLSKRKDIRSFLDVSEKTDKYSGEFRVASMEAWENYLDTGREIGIGSGSSWSPRLVPYRNVKYGINGPQHFAGYVSGPDAALFELYAQSWIQQKISDPGQSHYRYVLNRSLSETDKWGYWQIGFVPDFTLENLKEESKSVVGLMVNRFPEEVIPGGNSLGVQLGGMLGGYQFATRDSIPGLNDAPFIKMALGEEVYFGQLVDRRPEGIGIIINPVRGYAYIGSFVGGEYAGFGIMKQLTPNGYVLQMGHWVPGEGMVHGAVASDLEKQGPVYVGQLKRGLPNGQGYRHYGGDERLSDETMTEAGMFANGVLKEGKIFSQYSVQTVNSGQVKDFVLEIRGDEFELRNYASLKQGDVIVLGGRKKLENTVVVETNEGDRVRIWAEDANKNPFYWDLVHSGKWKLQCRHRFCKFLDKESAVMRFTVGGREYAYFRKAIPGTPIARQGYQNALRLAGEYQKAEKAKADYDKELSRLAKLEKKAKEEAEQEERWRRQAELKRKKKAAEQALYNHAQSQQRSGYRYNGFQMSSPPAYQPSQQQSMDNYKRYLDKSIGGKVWGGSYDPNSSY